MALVGLLIALLLGGLLWTRWSPPSAGPTGGGGDSPPPFTGAIERARDSVDRLEEVERQRQEELRQLP
jgi:hypothetical protein